MLGIVLCGGQSLRMGADKGLLYHQDKLWAEMAKEKLEALGLGVKFSINNAQHTKYRGFFGDEQLITDLSPLDVKGPLLGVLSAHLANPDEDLLLLACDLLLMEVRVLQKLLQSFVSDNSFEAYVFTKNDQQEPLCGIYTAKGLQKIALMQQTGKLAKHSMKFVLSHLKVCEIPVEDNDYRCFDNFNSHAEINGL